MCSIGLIQALAPTQDDKCYPGYMETFEGELETGKEEGEEAFLERACYKERGV